MELTLHNAALAMLCILAVYFDLLKKKIPNLLTFPFMLAGLLYHLVVGSLGGLWFSFLGMAAGIALLILPFAIGGVGGGDVKFLGAVGALQGAGFTLVTLVAGAFLGGLMAFVYLIIKGRLGITLRRLFGVFLSPLFSKAGIATGSRALLKLGGWFSPPRDSQEPKLYLPYGVPLALAALLAVSGLLVRLIPGFNHWL